ncbi:MAG: APC family permease [Patulibacter sp.]
MSPLPPNPDGAPTRGRPTLAGTLGARHIVFMVVAAAAPMAVVIAIMPIALALGNGVGTPGMFLVASLVLLVFSLGYTRMTPHVRNAGAFYAYIAHGLGKPLGLVAAYSAVIAYNSLSAATCGALAFFAHDTANNLLGVDLPWTVWAAIAIAIVAVLGYRKITLTARVLGVALLAEVLVLLALDVAILIDRGPGAYSFDVFAPTNVFGGVVGVAIIYAFSSYLGFEGTAIYAEEAREPRRAVPRATYAAVAIVGTFYVLTSWSLLAAYGGERSLAIAGENPGGYVFGLTDQFIGSAVTDITNVLTVTSAFAAVLAFHNAAARYFFALSRDGFLPAALSRTHPRHGSPYVAGMTQVAVLVVIVGGFAIAGLDPLLNLSTAMTGFGAVGLLSLLTVTSAAIAAFFWRRGEHGGRTTVAPIAATLGLGTATVLALANYPSLTGSDSQLINSLPWLYLPVLAAGLAFALWIRRRAPETYAGIGRTPIAEELERE